MQTTPESQAIAQTLWLDSISRTLLDSGRLADYIERLAIRGLTSNPAVFETALQDTEAYAADIRAQAAAGLSDSALLIELTLSDLRRAADLLRPIFEASDGIDGWVSIELSPMLAFDTEASMVAARGLHARAERPNLMVKVPGTEAGLRAVERLTFEGVPVNTTLLFSREHYLAAAEAYMSGLERRQSAGLDLAVGAVASIFVSRWDVAVRSRLPARLHNHLGIAMAGRIYASYRRLLSSARWRALAAAGAQPQRLLWASTGSKDPAAAPTLYVRALRADLTINTLPEPTLLAWAEERISAESLTTAVTSEAMGTDAEAAEACLREIAAAGVEIGLLAAQLQLDGVAAFAQSWRALLRRIAAQRA
jgi:transaldolase